MVLLFLYDVKTLGKVIMKLRLEKYKVVHYYSDVSDTDEECVLCVLELYYNSNIIIIIMLKMFGASSTAVFL